MAPGVSFAFQGDVEPDARTVPWPVLHRLALEAGLFPPAYQPVSRDEIYRLLDAVLGVAMSPEKGDIFSQKEFETIRWWRDFYRDGGGGYAWRACECKTHPVEVRLGGTVLAGYAGAGEPLAGEAGLPWANGLNAAFEPRVTLSAGAFWASGAVRASGRVFEGGHGFSPDDPLSWPRWSVPTGRSQVRGSRVEGGDWRLDLTRLVGGVRLGRWSLSAGQTPLRLGPGLGGGLALDRDGPAFPAVTLRRNQPFRWSGLMNLLAPSHALMRVGSLSSRTVYFQDEWGRQNREAAPWFMQWLVGWQPVSWFRVGASHSVMAVSFDGTLWPDLLQINFPLVGTTWRESASGPVTDRIFSAQFELRWGRLPVPFLPGAGGRVWWEYAGTDFLPSGPWGLIPRISIPASVVGIELVEAGWDVAAEYTELVADNALWYSNGGFTDGYSHRGWLLGHPLGGSGESIMGLVRVRPDSWPVQLEGRYTRSTWGARRVTPGTGRREGLGLTVSKLPGLGTSDLRWHVTGEFVREEAIPFAAPAGTAVASTLDWWRLQLKLDY